MRARALLIQLPPEEYLLYELGLLLHQMDSDREFVGSRFCNWCAFYKVEVDFINFIINPSAHTHTQL